ASALTALVRRSVLVFSRDWFLSVVGTDFSVPPVADAPAEGGRPQPGDGPAAGVGGQVGLAVEPARRHDPAVLALEVPLGRPRNRVLVPGVTAVHRVAKRVPGDKHLLVLPVLVVRGPEQNADAE